MSTQPVIEFRSNTTPFPVLASVQFQGTGFGNSIIVGQSSSVVTFRIYNNFAAAAGIGDAINCVLASYDDTAHQGAATLPAVVQKWLNVQVMGYDGGTTNADTQFYPIGGSQKHAVPVNSSTLAGAAAHYITVNAKVVVPVSATAASITHGLWLEYSWV